MTQKSRWFRWTMIVLAVCLTRPAPAQVAPLKSLVVYNGQMTPGDTSDHLDLLVGKTGTLTARGINVNGIFVERPVMWSSGNPAVATVNARTGKVTARRIGYATITAAALSNGRIFTASARACVVPAKRFPLNPVTMQKGVAVKPSIPLPVVRDTFHWTPKALGDTLQMYMFIKLRADDTTRANIDSWGSCVHYQVNAGPAMPILDSTKVQVNHSGVVLIKCCVASYYPSATIGPTPQEAVQWWSPETRPSLRIAEGIVDKVAWGPKPSNWSLLR